MSGVTIGDGVVIANNSHVIKNVEPYSLIGGNPAKLIKKRFTEEQINKLLEIKCPLYRTITGEIPLYYWIQMQIQMEVCNMPECDYFECNFRQYADKNEYVLSRLLNVYH